MTRVEREFLAVADDAQPVGRDALCDEISARRHRSAFAQRQIVLGGSALVAMSFDRDRPGGVALEQRGVLVEYFLTGGTQVAAVELEKDWFERRVPIEIVERRRVDRIISDGLRRHIGRFSDRLRRRRRSW